MRASSRRSHHSSAAAGAAGARRELAAHRTPCCSSAASAGRISGAGKPKGRASVSAVTGPSASKRLRTSSRSALSRSATSLASAVSSSRCHDARQREPHFREPLGATHDRAGTPESRPSSRGRRRAGARSRSRHGAPSGAVTKPSSTSASCSSSAFSACGHASARTRAIASASSEPSSAACSARKIPARLHGERAALLGRRVVEERVRLRAENFLRERRRARELAAHDFDFARFDALEQARTRPSMSMFTLRQVVERLLHERVIGDVAVRRP